MKFRLTVASSGVGVGATGGILSTALCRYGIGMLQRVEVQVSGDRRAAR